MKTVPFPLFPGNAGNTKRETVSAVSRAFPLFPKTVSRAFPLCNRETPETQLERFP